MTRIRTYLLTLFPFAVALAIWALLSESGLLNRFILPPPSAVARTLIDDFTTGELFMNTAASLRRVGVGFAISLLTAIPMGIAIGSSFWLRSFFEPLFKLLRPIPPIAWIPLAILWFGIGHGPAYFLTMIASFFPILTNTITGVENVSQQHLAVARCFRASRLSVLCDVILPSALPVVISGIRTGFGFAWMAVVAAEMIATRSGLGYLIHVSQDLLRTDRVLVGMLAIGAIGFVSDSAFVWVRNRWVRWI